MFIAEEDVRDAPRCAALMPKERARVESLRDDA